MKVISLKGEYLPLTPPSPCFRNLWGFGDGSSSLKHWQGNPKKTSFFNDESQNVSSFHTNALWKLKKRNIALCLSLVFEGHLCNTCRGAVVGIPIYI